MAITMILFTLAPATIIIIGPSATLGKEFKQVKNGSKTLYKFLYKYSRVETIILNNNPIKKAINVS